MGKKILAMLLAGLMVFETGTMQVAATENQTVYEHGSTEESAEILEFQGAEENANEEVLEPQGAEENTENLEPGEAEENASEEALEPQRAESGESQTAEPIDQAAVSPGEGLESQVHIGDRWKKEDFGFGYYDYFIGNEVKSDLIEQDFEAYVVDLSQEKKISLSVDFVLNKKYSQLKYATIKIAVYRLDNSKENYYKVEKKLWEKQTEVPQKGFALKEEMVLQKGSYGIVIENLQENTKLSYNFNTEDISTYIEQISIPKKIYLEQGKTEVIPVTDMKPKGAVKDITWLSSDVEVATVNGAGKVKARKGGNCIITARLRNGREYYCRVYVEAPTLSKKNLRMIKGETYTLKMHDTYHPVTWKSKNPKIAKVDKKGKVTGKKKGTTYIWASVGKQKFKCKVIVEEPKLSKKNLKIGKGGSTELYLTGTKRKPKWSTSSKKIVTIKNGKITAKKKGKANITASIGKMKYTCRITVGDCPLKSTSLKVAVKGRRNIETRKKEKKIKWSSSAPKVASVKNGVVVGKKKGQAVIKVKIGDVNYTCKVKVENPKINSKSITLERNRSYTLKMKNTTMKAKWSSSNSSIATVNAAGKVSGRSRGSAVITADIGGKKITCKVRVRGEWPNFSVNLIDEIEYYYIAGVIKVNNDSSQPMRICKENFVLNNGSYSSFSRNLTIVSVADILAEDSKLTPIPYVDIAPGQSERIAFIVEGPSSYYVPSSIFQFEMIYDGERYRISVGWQHGLTLYRY